MARFNRPTLVLGAVILIAAVAAPAAVLSRRAGQDRSDRSIANIIAQVEHDTERVRGLHARHAVPVSLLSPVAFRRLVARDFDRDTTAAAIRNERQPLVLLGIISPGTDLRSVLRRAETDNVAAFYDSKLKRFFVPLQPGGISLNDQVTISHEYTHALQDQTFDLGKVQPDTSHQSIHDSDRDLARTALIEGDATVEMQLYAQSTFTQAQYVEFQKEANRAAAGASDNTPPFLLDAMLFPYTQGSVFEQSLLQQAAFSVSFAVVNQAFRRPPNSTRELMHPSLYPRNPTAPDGAPDLPVPHPALPPGWRRVDSDVIGQFELQDILAQRISPLTAIRAADGWRADRYALYDHGADFLMAWRLHTPSTAAARAITGALLDYWSRRFHTMVRLHAGMATHTAVDSTMALRISGPDVELVMASRGELQSIVVTALNSMASH